MDPESQVSVPGEHTPEAKPMAEAGIAEQAVETDLQATEDQPNANVQGSSGELPENLPDEPDKQRQAFVQMRKRMKEQEQQLAEFTRAKQAEESKVIDEVRTHVPQQRPQLDPAIDPNDPYTRAIMPQITTAHQEAMQARKESAEMRARLEDMEAEAAYPQLRSKSDQFDPGFTQRVKEKYLYERFQAGSSGKAIPTLAEVAGKVEAEYRGNRSASEAESLAQATKTLEQKQQAAFEPRQSSANIQKPAGNRDELRKQINKGNLDAVAERLMDTELAKFSDKDLGFH